MTVSVVTPWLAHPELVADYVAAIERGPFPDEVVIVDNGDAPTDEIQARVGGAVSVVEPGWNAGFSGGSNYGLDRAAGEIVVFLNNDIARGCEGWLERLAENVEPGVLVGAELCYQPHGDVDGVAHPYLDGWCFGGLRDDLLALGGFDESYAEPAYFSDAELCIRARAAGLRLREVLTGLVHKRGRTAGPAHLESVRTASFANHGRYVRLVRSLKAAA